MPPAANFTPEAKLDYKSGATPAARRNTLERGGPLVVSAVHLFVKMLPEKYVTDIGGTFEIDLHLVEYLTMEGFLYDDEMVQRDMAWYPLPSRLSRFLQDLIAGKLIDEKPVGDPAELRDLIKKGAVGLTVAQRQLKAADAHAYPSVNPPLNMWEKLAMSAMTGMTVGTDNDISAAVDAKCILADAYVDVRRNDANGKFQEACDILIDAAGSGLAAKSINIQASAVAAFIVRTQPEVPNIRTYYSYDQQGQEMRIRMLPTASERFEARLSNAWTVRDDKGGYAQLSAALPKACNGRNAISWIKTMATRVGLSPKLEHATCQALCDMLEGPVLSEADTPELRDATNEIRCKAIGDLLAKAQSKKAGDSLVDSVKVSKLLEQEWFKAGIKNLEVLAVTEPDYNKVIIEMAKSAQGRIYIISGEAAASIYKQFKAARNKAQMGMALGSVLCVDYTGKPLSRGADLELIAHKLIAGKISTKEFDPWMDLCKKIVAIRNSQSASDNEDQTTGGAFWADSSRLELCIKIMYSAFQFIGHDGNHTGSFRSFYQYQRDNARVVADMPHWYPAKAGMRIQLAKIGTEAMDGAAQREQMMITEPLAAATIPSLFCPAESKAGKMMAEFAKDVERALAEIRHMENYGGPSAFGPPSKRGYESLTPSWQTAQERQPKERKTNETGSLLAKYGVFMSSHGPVFGGKMLVRFAQGTAPTMEDMRTKCCGCYSYFRIDERRAAWCSLTTCVSHHRPAGLTEDKIQVINLHANDNTGDLATIAKAVIDEKASWQHVAGANDRHAIMGGKGGASIAPYQANAVQPRPNSGKGGRGKGAGGGKGKGRGGKGKGNGKGQARFGRQH